MIDVLLPVAVHVAAPQGPAGSGRAALGPCWHGAVQLNTQQRALLYGLSDAS